MTRRQVIDVLGRPLAENQNDVMSYARDPFIFDVYRNGGDHHVRELVIAGGTWKLSDGTAIFKAGALKRLSARYGERLKFHRFDDGSPYYELVTRLRGRKVRTDFPTNRRGLGAKVLDVFIVFA